MQLTRSLFIPANQPKFRRKIIEMLLARWINKQFSKDELIQLYVASVRYERNVIGLSNALKYYFGQLREKSMSEEEAFFLVERLSNVSSSVRWGKHSIWGIDVIREEVNSFAVLKQ